MTKQYKTIAELWNDESILTCPEGTIVDCSSIGWVWRDDGQPVKKAVLGKGDDDLNQKAGCAPLRTGGGLRGE